MFVSSAGPKISEGGVHDLAHFSQVRIPPGAGPLPDAASRWADPERPQD